MDNPYVLQDAPNEMREMRGHQVLLYSKDSSLTVRVIDYQNGPL